MAPGALWARRALLAVDYVAPLEPLPQSAVAAEEAQRGGRGARLGLGGNSGLLDGRDLQHKLDLVADEEAAGLEGGVPHQAPVLAVQRRGPLEPGPGVAERVLR